MTPDDETICYWCCPNCGQMHFADLPPDLCDYCDDFTTWQLVSGYPPVLPPTEPIQRRTPPHDGEHPQQRRLFED